MTQPEEMNPTPGDGDLESRKKLAEIAKLKAEATKLGNEQRWLWTFVRAVKLTEWVTAISAILLVYGGWYSGLFNAMRERLETDKNRLAVEKIDLEQKREKLGTEVAAKERELADIKARLAPFERQQRAIQGIHSLGNESKAMWAEFKTDARLDEISVSLHRRLLGRIDRT
jgi:hypothetical protein